MLLSYGSDSDWIDRVIVKLDDGIYSHAAVWDGECVVEATTRGVLRTTLEDEETQQYLDAYRWQPSPPNGHVLGDTDYPSEPVTHEADTIAASGAKYSYHKLMLAALVIGVSKVPPDPITRTFVRKVLNQFAKWVLALEKDGKRGMTCTEVVSTTFWDASPQRRYAINIRVDGSRDSEAIRAVAGGPRGQLARRAVSGYERDKRKCLALFLKGASSLSRDTLRRWGEAQADALKLGPRVTQGGGPDVPLACVTPRDLQRSPDLKCIGRLPHRPGAASSDTTPADLSRVLGRL
ncbi:MAG TPA: hypothetical protein VM736_06705 [Gemmatimonadales bacterium]|nr:hypothetical protein [Gemmatimonadales bacterium]